MVRSGREVGRVQAGLHRLAFNQFLGTENWTLAGRGKRGEVGAIGGKAGIVEKQAGKGENTRQCQPNSHGTLS